MKYLMRGWIAASLKHPAERTKHDFDIITDQYPDQVELSTMEANHAVRVSFLSLAIISGIVSFFVWSYFTIVLHSYYKTLLLGGAGNFVNINGVEYFAPTERIAGKSVPQDVPPQLNVPPSYYTASAYPIQPTISYPQAPPSYDEAAGPNASMYPSFPPTRQ
ncbi:hypothetical protein V9T40_014925 [Parthenolecanium corni]|uniref:Uncharacterized protein n=1 Tax=Parthenolecanium corni TaxID=536013 RepID=A0AAN9TZ54_9HEMI